MSTTGKSFYFTEGILHANAPSYIERSADQELLEKVQAGYICYVLSSRQMGKSSLMNRTARRLKAAKTHTAIVDLTAIGSNIETGAAEKWYFGIANKIKRDLRLKVDLNAWWEANANLTAVNRLTEFYSEVLLEKLSGPIVIFIDEIDSTIPLAFTDDFFAAIRACFQARASDERFQRLSFVLLGVATPTDLMKDPRRTPFNIGESIDLRDFTREEALHLTAELAETDAKKKQILDWVYDWTGGHPYLTQKLCLALAQEKEREISADLVDETVQTLFFSPGAAQSEHNLKFVRERLLRSGGHTATRRTLKIYRDVYQGKMVLDDPISPAHNTLKLAGVAVAGPERRLTVRNRLYREVFSDNWLGKNMPANRQLYYSLSVAALFLIALGIWYRVFLPQEFLQQMAEAREDVPNRAYQDLRSFWGLADLADEAFADYWERRARQMEFVEDRDRAILYQLQAVKIADISRRREEAARLTGGDYQHLLTSYLHSSSVTAAAFSPGGDTVITASSDGAARLWRADDGTPFGQTMYHNSNVLAVAFSPDGNTVITTSFDNNARLWRADDGTPFGQTMYHGDWVRAVAFSPDGNTVITASDDKTARLWRADDGTPFGQTMYHNSNVLAVAFSPDGNTVITASVDSTAKLWRADDGTPFGQTMNHGGWVLAVAFSPNGNTVITASSDKTARLWRADDGTPIGQTMNHNGSVTAVAFSPDGNTVITASDDNTARLWRADDGTPSGQTMNHKGSVTAVAFSPNGNTVITASDDNTARLWRADDGTPSGQTMYHNSNVLAVAFSPDGNTVITASDDKTARLWRVADGKPIEMTMNHNHAIQTVAFSPDGNTVITAGSDSTARLWRAADGTPIGQTMNHEGAVRAVAFSPDGSTVITASLDGTARLWSAADGTPIGQVMNHNFQVLAAAFSPDGKTIITISTGYTAKLWSATGGTPIGQAMNHRATIQAVAFSPNSSTVITAGSDSTARLWRAADGTPIGQTMNHNGIIRAVTFSPDGNTIITTSSDRTARLWRAVDGTPIGQNLNHNFRVESAVFSSDGNTVITASSDNTARLWRAADGTPIGQTINHNGVILAVTFSPDGKNTLSITNSWLHYSNIPSDTLALPLQISRWKPFSINQARYAIYDFFFLDVQAYKPTFRFIDAEGKKIQMIRFRSDREFFVDTVDFSQPGAPPITGEPAALLAEWERKLGLRLNTTTGEIAPRYPVPKEERDFLRLIR